METITGRTTGIRRFKFIFPNLVSLKEVIGEGMGGGSAYGVELPQKFLNNIVHCTQTV